MKKMSDEALAAMRAADDKATDWQATCPLCGEKLIGTKAELLAHKCRVNNG